MKNPVYLIPLFTATALWFSACNINMQDGAEEIEALQAANSALKKEAEEQQQLIDQLKQEVTASQEEVFSLEERIVQIQNAGPPMPPEARLVYDAGLVTTTGEQMKLSDVTFGDTERALPSRIKNGTVLWGFAAIDTFQRIGKPTREAEDAPLFMPAILMTHDYQEIKIDVLVHDLAGDLPNGKRVEVPLEEVNAMRLRERHVPEARD